MKRPWIYITITVLCIGAAIHCSAASAGDAQRRAADLAADYRILSENVPLGMPGDILIEARLPIDGVEEQMLSTILSSLPPEAETALVFDRFHHTRWLHITCKTGADGIYGDALGILTALGSISPDAIQLSLNASWHTAARYSTAEKENLIDGLFASIKARTVASMADGRIVSASGYSHLLNARTGEGPHAMNITASLCAGPRGSTLWLGTPVLTVEY